MPSGHIWTGPDPAVIAEASRLELGTIAQALIPVTLTGVRVFGYPNGPARPGLMARVWNLVDRSLMTSVPLPEVLPAGWHTAPLSLDLDAGDTVLVSYDTDGGYGFLNNAMTAPVLSPDYAMRFPKGPGNGRYNPSPGLHPDAYTAGSPFYCVDVTYAWEGTPPPPPPPPPGDKPVNSEQLGVAWLTWLRSVDPSVPPASTTRPANAASWAGTGFLVVSVVGDASGPDNDYRAPILSVDAWTYTPNSGKPQWEWAAGIAQTVRNAAARGLVPPAALPIRSGYHRARVDTVWKMTEIRRVPEPDGSSYAHFSVDIGLGWVEVPT